MATNYFEDTARAEKVTKLVELLKTRNVSPEVAERMSDIGWNAACGIVGVNKASETTRKAVVEALKFKPVLPDDPFAGFPKGNV